jgi:hypothetical protein
VIKEYPTCQIYYQLEGTSEFDVHGSILFQVFSLIVSQSSIQLMNSRIIFTQRTSDDLIYNAHDRILRVFFSAICSILLGVFAECFATYLTPDSWTALALFDVQGDLT